MSDKKDIVKEYSNGEVTVVWKPGLCMHSAICFKGLPEVFDPRSRPWINMGETESQRIVEQVKKCPSGALSYYFSEESAGPGQPPAGEEEERIVEVLPNGPLMVHGLLTVKHPDGSATRKEKKTAFCRCGGSGNKPFCDGTHRKIGFQG